MYCHHQATAALGVRWYTTAQFVWLASSAPVRSTGTQEQSRWAPLREPPGLAHRPPSRDLSGCFYLRCRSHTPCTSRQPSCPAQRTSFTIGFLPPRAGNGPFSLALAPCWDLETPPGTPLRLSVHMRAFTPLGVPQLVRWRTRATQHVLYIPPPWRGSMAQPSYLMGTSFPLRFMAPLERSRPSVRPDKYHGAPPGLLSPVPPSMRAKVHCQYHVLPIQIDLSLDRLGPLSLALAPWGTSSH